MRDNELDALLRLRRVPAAPAGLAERIIHAALEQKRSKRFDLREFWIIFCEEFMLPKPALALAALLLFSATVGFTGEIQSYFSDDDTQGISAYNVVDNSYEDGALL